MKRWHAISTGEFKTIIVAPKGSTKAALKKRADKYIKGKYKIIKK